jgi:hypothetical protein
MWCPMIVYRYEGPRNADGVLAWPWLPLAVLAIAVVVQVLAHPRVPVLGRILVTLVGAAVIMLGGWIA